HLKSCRGSQQHRQGLALGSGSQNLKHPGSALLDRGYQPTLLLQPLDHRAWPPRAKTSPAWHALYLTARETQHQRLVFLGKFKQSLVGNYEVRERFVVQVSLVDESVPLRDHGLNAGPDQSPYGLLARGAGSPAFARHHHRLTLLSP